MTFAAIRHALRQVFRRWERTIIAAYVVVLSMVALSSAAAIASYRLSTGVEKVVESVVERQRTRVEQRLSRAADLAHDRPEAAVELLENLIADIPLNRRHGRAAQTRFAAQRLLGGLLAGGESPARAIPVVEQLIKDNPGVAREHALAGRLLSQLHQPERAEQQWLACLKLDPNHTSSCEALVRQLLARGDNRAAIEVYDRYWQALHIAGTGDNPDHGVILEDGSDRVARWPLMPIVDGKQHTYRFLAARQPQLQTATPVDHVRLDLDLGPVCGRIDLAAIVVQAAHDDWTEQAASLAEIDTFADADQEGAEHVPGTSGRFDLDRARIRIRASLATPIPADQIDQIVITMTASKRFDAALSSDIESVRRRQDEPSGQLASH